ncbi:MAG: C39 family peptidase, partial [Terrimicrobiaceae bacterium]
PMVDQGEKGYCVVASVERVLRYYGATVDQYELAQIANSDAVGGTSLDAMLASLKRLTSRLGVKVRSLYEWNSRDFLKMVEDYNRATKRGKLAPEIELSGQMIDADACFAKMKPEIFKEVRMKNTADFGRFKRDIQRTIDEGTPLLWSVRLGIVSEKEIPQAFGGHMRIIIGYNTATNEILYTDSWGMGHEEKRMAADDAWTITNGLSSLQPVS